MFGFVVLANICTFDEGEKISDQSLVYPLSLFRELAKRTSVQIAAVATARLAAVCVFKGLAQAMATERMGREEIAVSSMCCVTTRQPQALQRVRRQGARGFVLLPTKLAFCSCVKTHRSAREQ